MKIVLGIICLLFCVFMGKVLAKKYTDRRIFYSDLFEFNKKFRVEITFSQNTLPTIISEFRNKEGIFYKNLNEFFNTNKSVALDKNIFSEQENDFFIKYLNSLGKSDKNSQLNQIDSFTSEIENKVSITKTEEEKYKKLYKKLGFLIGLILLIMLI